MVVASADPAATIRYPPAGGSWPRVDKRPVRTPRLPPGGASGTPSTPPDGEARKKTVPPMICTLVLRPVARALAVTLVLAHTVLATRIPELPDWDNAGNPASP